MNEVQDVELERLRSTIEDTDYAEAAATMSLRQTAYQASLAASLEFRDESPELHALIDVTHPREQVS